MSWKENFEMIFVLFLEFLYNSNILTLSYREDSLCCTYYYQFNKKKLIKC